MYPIVNDAHIKKVTVLFFSISHSLELKNFNEPTISHEIINPLATIPKNFVIAIIYSFIIINIM